MVLERNSTCVCGPLDPAQPEPEPPLLLQTLSQRDGSERAMGAEPLLLYPTAACIN